LAAKITLHKKTRYTTTTTQFLRSLANSLLDYKSYSGQQRSVYSPKCKYMLMTLRGSIYPGVNTFTTLRGLIKS